MIAGTGLVDEGGLIVGAIALFLVLCHAAFTDLRRKAQRMKGAFSSRNRHAAAIHEEAARDRESVDSSELAKKARELHVQHERIDELSYAKMRAEIMLLESHAKLQKHNDDGLLAAKEQHELMTQKAQLEIESLRLHIAEQRRRLDDQPGR